MKIENCRMHGQVSQDSLYWMRNQRMDLHGLGGDKKKTKDFKTRQCMTRNVCKHLSDASKRKEKRKWAIEKPRLDNARRLRGIFFSEPDDEEFKRVIKMLVESWKFRCQQQCLVKLSTGKPVALLDNTRRNMLVLLKPTNLWEYAWKGLRARTMQITSQGEAWIHWVTKILCTNLFLCLKPWKYQMQRQQCRSNGENWREYRPAWQLTKVKNKNDVITEARNGHTVHFASLMDLCHLKNSELEPQVQKF